MKVNKLASFRYIFPLETLQSYVSIRVFHLYLKSVFPLFMVQHGERTVFDTIRLEVDPMKKNHACFFFKNRNILVYFLDS